MRRLSAVLALCAAVAAAPAARAAEPPTLLRISTENTADHVQTQAVSRFAAELERRSGGRLAVEHHFDARMFRDRDVVKALRQGKAEMAVPGTWQLDRLESSVAIFLLPAFYGRADQSFDRLRDGPVGREVAGRIEENLGLKVLGRWIDLGWAHVYGIRRQVDDHGDLKDLRVRVAGGEANLMRLSALGAQPRVVAWPDLPRAVEDGMVDGILTTHETVASGDLRRLGVTSAFEDHQYFAQYVPLVAGGFWRRLPPDLRRLMEEVWEENVPAARRDAALAQAEARARLAAEGVAITAPAPQLLALQRRRMIPLQPAMIEALAIDRALVERAMALLEDDP